MPCSNCAPNGACERVIGVVVSVDQNGKILNSRGVPVSEEELEWCRQKLMSARLKNSELKEEFGTAFVSEILQTHPIEKIETFIEMKTGFIR